MHNKLVHIKIKVWHDKHIKVRTFQEGDWACLCDSRFKYFQGIIMTRWMGPYLEGKCHDNGIVQSRQLMKKKFLFS